MFLLGFWLPLWAVEPVGTPAEPPAMPSPEFWSHMWEGFVGALILGLLGIVLAVLGFKVFDWITPRINIQHELGEKHNIAVAILMGAVVLGICHVIAAAVK
jgi:putative membrane protein